MTDPKKTMTEAEIDERLRQLKDKDKTETEPEPETLAPTPQAAPEPEQSILQRAVEKVLPQPAPPEPEISLLPLDQEFLMGLHGDLEKAHGRYNIDYVGEALKKLILHLAENSEGE